LDGGIVFFLGTGGTDIIFLEIPQSLDLAVLAEIPDMKGLNLQHPEVVVVMFFSAFDTIHSVAPLLLIPKRRREVLLFGMRALPNGSALKLYSAAGLPGLR
jgi:hypothetical protein